MWRATDFIFVHFTRSQKHMNIYFDVGLFSVIWMMIRCTEEDSKSNEFVTVHWINFIRIILRCWTKWFYELVNGFDAKRSLCKYFVEYWWTILKIILFTSEWFLFRKSIVHLISWIYGITFLFQIKFCDKIFN